MVWLVQKRKGGGRRRRRRRRRRKRRRTSRLLVYQGGRPVRSSYITIPKFHLEQKEQKKVLV
jgi:hypothetical protein